MADLPRNVRLFITFRILFNARFYYPVLAVMFVDMGLTLDQYTMLNVAWAVSIVLAELPLGALGDQIGRKPLIVGAAALMIVEMAVLAFTPLSWAWLFWVFMVNRVLSGVAEAAASGADEALAYDTLDELGRKAEWPDVLGRLQRRMSVAFIVAMVTGGLVYDPGLVNGVLGALGSSATVSQQTTARFPVYLTLLLSLGAFAAAVRLREVGEASTGSGLLANVRGILRAGVWIWRTRFALAIIAFGLVLDSAVRLFITMISRWYRLVGIPSWSYGLLGALFGALGVVVPSIAQRMVLRRSPLANHVILLILTAAGLVGVAAVQHPAAVLFMVLLAGQMQVLGFFASHYMNAVAESSQRATILSFKSLANNLAYGAAGWAFALLLRHHAGGTKPPPDSPLEASSFAQSLWALPAVLGVAGVLLVLWALTIPTMRTPLTGAETDDDEGATDA